MKFKNGLSLFTRTNGRSVNIASFHSPHSLTWSWLFSLSWQRPELARPKGQWSRIGDHLFRSGGIGSALSAYAMRHNGGWQFGLTVLGVGLSWHNQRPMWFRDLYHRSRDHETFGGAPV